MKKIILLFMFLFLISFVSAAPPVFTQIIDEGISIDFPKITVLEQNQDYTFNFHAFNTSNGIRLTNSTTNCTLHLFDNKGDHIVNEMNMPFVVADGDWELTVTSGNFSRIGEYAYLITCQSTENLGGSVSVRFHVTESGFMVDEGQAIIYSIALICALLFLGLFLWGAIAIPFGHPTDPEQNIVSVNDLRFVKIFLIAISYVMAMFIFGLLKSITSGLLFFTGISNLFNWGYWVMLSFLWPLIVLTFIITFVMFVHGLTLKNKLRRGLTVKR